MGRTIPSFRIAEAREASEWKPFRGALSKRDQEAFDEMLCSAMLYTSASSAAVRTSKFEGMTMAIILRQYMTLAGLLRALQDRPERRGKMLLSDEAAVEELGSWRHFARSVSGEDEALLAESLAQGQEYTPAIQAQDSTTDALIMSLMLAQHKEISRLAGELEQLKGRNDARVDL